MVRKRAEGVCGTQDGIHVQWQPRRLRSLAEAPMLFARAGPWMGRRVFRPIGRSAVLRQGRRWEDVARRDPTSPDAQQASAAARSARAATPSQTHGRLTSSLARSNPQATHVGVLRDGFRTRFDSRRLHQENGSAASAAGPFALGSSGAPSPTTGVVPWRNTIAGLFLAAACGPSTEPAADCDVAPLDGDSSTPTPYEARSIPDIACDHASALVPGPLHPLPTWPLPGEANYEGSRISLELSLERTNAEDWQQSATFSIYSAESWNVDRFDGWRCGIELDPLDAIDDCRVRAYFGVELRYGIWPFLEPDLRPIEVDTPEWTETIPRVSDTYHHAVFSSPPAWGEPYGISWAPDGMGFTGAAISRVVHLGRELAIEEPAPADAIGSSAIRVRWSGCSETPVLLTLTAAELDLDSGDVVEVLCRVEDDGEFTIPAIAVHLIDPTWRAELSLERAEQRAHAIDDGTLFAQARTVDAIELGAPR